MSSAAVIVLVLCPIFAMAGTAWTNCEADASTVGQSFWNGYVISASQYAYTCGSTALAGGSYTDHNYVNSGDDYPFYLSGSARSFSNASAGFNHVFASASSVNTPMSYVYTDDDGNTQSIDNNDHVWTGSNATSAWRDQITITSSSLRPGTIVSLQNTFALHVSAGGNPSLPDDKWNEQIALFSNAWLTLPPGWTRYWNPYSRIIEYDYQSDSIQCASSGMCAPVVFTFTQNVQVGSTYTIGASVYGGVMAWTGMEGYGPFVSNANEFFDASSTGIYTLNMLTPGASFVSSSGYRYSATPEPGTLLLAGPGLAALAGMIRRKRI